jgi:hypothetical protein
MPLASPKCFTSRYKVRLIEESPAAFLQVCGGKSSATNRSAYDYYRPCCCSFLNVVLTLPPPRGGLPAREVQGGIVPENRWRELRRTQSGKPLLPRRTVWRIATLMPTQDGEDPGVWMPSATVYAVFANLRTHQLIVFQPASLPIDHLWCRRGQASPACYGGSRRQKNTRDAIATFAVSGQPVGRWKNSQLVVKRPRIG